MKQKLLLFTAALAVVIGSIISMGQSQILGYRDLPAIASPANAPAGFLRLFNKTGTGFVARDSAGVETTLGGGGGGGGSATHTHPYSTGVCSTPNAGGGTYGWYSLVDIPPTSNNATGACFGSTDGMGAIAFPNGQTSWYIFKFQIPRKWDGIALTSTAAFSMNGTDTTNAVKVQVSLACFADDSIFNDTPSYNTASSLTKTAVTATVNHRKWLTFVGLNQAGCVAGGWVRMRVLRDATDTYPASIHMLGGDVEYGLTP